MQGYYHSVETFGTVDGKGIRYVLFLSGCSLGCRFCHNPDTWERGSQTITVSEVLADYRRYRPYYEASGGGITVSGGEPLLQAEFVADLFAACRAEGIHTTLDTSGFAPMAALAKVLPYTDAVLFGLKAAKEETHRLLTNAGSDSIQENLAYVAAAPVELTARYILIPGVNDGKEELSALAELLGSLPRPVALDLLPYHNLGAAKWERLGWPYSLTGIRPATDEDVEKVRRFLEGEGLFVM